MSALKVKLGVFDNSAILLEQLKEQEPQLILPAQLDQEILKIELLIINLNSLQTGSLHSKLIEKLNLICEKIVIVTKQKESFDYTLLLGLRVDSFIFSEELSSDFINNIWQDLRQKEQDETYLSLSSELNQQYEILKTELEKKLSEKSKHIIESRKQIFEINNRVEFLRKSLYSTTEVKSLTEAEAALNDLLVKFGMITWFKIVNQTDVKQFEEDLKNKLESSVYSSQINIDNVLYFLYFVKGDKRPFRKSDINYFNKLTEALQINLSRYNNLLALQKNERLFDLAFHSSPHPIIVVDKEYNVYQANLSAEKSAPEDHENLKCYQLLFARSKPCAGCHFGSKFEIQKDFKTYAVQSNKFNNTLDSDSNYWIHLYEDISEQKDLENKFQQTAKLSEVGLISSSIAHELNNPLGGILSYLQIMKMELAPDHPFQEDIKFLIEAALRMKKHIEDLLFFSRKEDVVKLEHVDLNDVFDKNLDLMQMQLKKEHVVVSFVQENESHFHEVSILHFRNIIHLVFQFFIHKLKLKRQYKTNFSGLVEVKISQDQSHSYLSFNSNLGPHDTKLNSNDLSLITLEKSVLDQGFQLVISEPQPNWLQVLIKLPKK